jgi:hypothetical protein
MDESNTACAVWIVFNRSNATGDAVFHTAKIDNAVTALVTTTTMA